MSLVALFNSFFWVLIALLLVGVVLAFITA